MIGCNWIKDKACYGNENAENDELLYHCAVPTPTTGGTGVKHILTGRWGTGKSARLLLANQQLNEALKSINPLLDRAWYVDEQSLDAGALSQAREAAAGDPQAFRKSLERLWTTEILRKAILLLETLRPIYGNPTGEHWAFVSAMNKVGGIAVSVWKQLTSVLKLLAQVDSPRLAGAHELKGHFADLLSDKAMQHIQTCLNDIKAHPIQPVIAIEPIETPTSALEQHAALAQEVVAALLNTFQSKFQPAGERQRLQVCMAIPWHRYSDDHVDLPQKIKQYKAYLQWSPADLRLFINKRIQYEFSRVKRSFTTKGDQDPWSALFTPTVKNGYCNPEVTEHSFEYALRHTHHRPRELQRLARKCVEECASVLGRSQDDVLKGIGGLRVEEAHFRAATTSYTRDASADVITEARRKFRKMDETVEYIKGMKVPFSKDDLKKRLQNSKSIYLQDAIDMLWQAGILGVEVSTRDGASHNLTGLLPEQGLRIYKNSKGKQLHRWYYFEYNYEGDANEFFVRFDGEPNIDVQFIFHPTTFEIFCGRVSIQCPIGI